ncbi:MAG: phosphoribosylamine--glycine ligase [candidate division Zixibacteria bacterium SM23_73_3]|nr:MAG: phosphoribosylamine--glycine ligase [candidate division Zixibacteria bacterium SM23_73_3]
MKVLVIGGGGREHALVWKLASSPLVDKLFVAPGNAGMAELAECADIKVEDLTRLADFAEKNSVDLTVVGPELPLTLGMVDEFERRNLKILGPSKLAAEIEGSKVFAKEFMKKYHIPTASFKVFDNQKEASDFVRSSEMPLVIKADGLAAGKGVVVVEDTSSALSTIRKIMVEKVFGSAGSRVVIEDLLKGEEITILAFTDGESISPTLSSQDHKKIFDGDRGPNTGGMGAYAPTTIVDDRMMKRIHDEILEPTVAGLKKEGRTFKGILYAGLMITDRGPKVMEFNCRFGDPEAQVILPLLKSDLMEIFLSIVEGELSLQDVEWNDNFAVCVVLASGGYPGKYERDKEISGLNRMKQMKDVLIFHAGSKKQKGRIFTNGGRVLGVTATDKSMKKAIQKAYSVVDKIGFEGMQYRKDIGCRAIRVKKKLW